MIKKFLILFAIILSLGSCGSFKNRGGIDQPVNANDRVKKNLEEGRGLKISTSLTENNRGNFSFASSNPLWRASLEKLDFIPLSNVDYGGGVIITDWYGDTDSDEQIKIAIRFLTSEIRSDALDVILYRKICKEINKCQTIKVRNKTTNEIKASILKRASLLSEETRSKKND